MTRLNVYDFGELDLRSLVKDLMMTVTGVLLGQRCDWSVEKVGSV